MRTMRVTHLVFVLATVAGCKQASKDGVAPPSGSTPGSATAPGSAPPASVAPTPPSRPTCGMASSPGGAKDLGKASLSLDGELLCGNYWFAHGYAEGTRPDTNMLFYAEDGTLEGPSLSRPSAGKPQRYTLLDKGKRIGVMITVAHKIGDAGEHVSANVEIDGYTLARWDGTPRTAEVVKDGMGWMMSPDTTTPGAHVSVSINRNGVREDLVGKSGKVTIERYDFAKHAFTGSFAIKVGPLEGLASGGEHRLEGTFDIRGYD